MRTLISDLTMMEHQTGPGHPERPERLGHLDQHLRQSGLWSDLQHRKPEPIAPADLARVHPSGYTQRLKENIELQVPYVDGGDTTVSAKSYEIALLAAGTAQTALSEVQKGNRVFCAVRPPGHHAEASRAMGFCLFNNIALCARMAQAQGLQKVLIVDWDVHHGNGTQAIFYEDPDVFFYSLHQYPFYPGTGSAAERGMGAGLGTTLNQPLRAGTTGDEASHLMEHDLNEISDQFKPDIILISAGFDGHRDDPLGGLAYDESTFRRWTEWLTDLAQRTCQGRLISYLEGGYNLNALAKSVEAHLEAL
ncbi:MAG: histone deacetylase [Acidobacteria bacterium]|nr:histone deacetylase [Acidobacteriota bacterium]MCB9398864.1 histone deacetylase [Acidobacteriota bacterium]